MTIGVATTTMVKAMRNHPLLFSFLVAAVMAVGLLLVAAPSAHSQESAQECSGVEEVFCLEKSVPGTATVGEPLTFTITGFCNPEFFPQFCLIGNPLGVEDVLPAGVEFVSAEATGGAFPAECVHSEGTVICSPESYQTASPFVVEIIVIPRRCGTFTNTARELGFPGNTVSVDFTVAGCEEAAPQQPQQGEAPQQGGAPAEITQEGEQESESGEIEQTFDIS